MKVGGKVCSSVPVHSLDAPPASKSILATAFSNLAGNSPTRHWTSTWRSGQPRALWRVDPGSKNRWATFSTLNQETPAAVRDGSMISMPTTSPSTEGDQRISGSDVMRPSCPPERPASWPLPTRPSGLSRGKWKSACVIACDSPRPPGWKKRTSAPSARWARTPTRMEVASGEEIQSEAATAPSPNGLQSKSGNKSPCDASGTSRWNPMRIGPRAPFDVVGGTAAAGKSMRNPTPAVWSSRVCCDGSSWASSVGATEPATRFSRPKAGSTAINNMANRALYKHWRP